MPFIDIEPLPLGTSLETPKGAFVTPGNDDVTLGSDAPAEPGWSDTFKAGWRQENVTTSQLTRKDLFAPTYKEEGFDPWPKIKGTPLELHWESFADVHNQRAFDMRVAQIEQEEADRRTLAAAPWYKAVPAAISAAVLDWPTLLPGGTVVRSAKGGLSIARTAASVGVASAVSAAAQEAALQAEQQTRPLEESVVGIGSSAIVGALIGPALAKGLDHIAWRQAIEAHDRFLAGEVPAARTAAAMPESVAMRAAPDEVAQDFKIQEEAPAPGEIDRAPEPAPVAAEGEGSLPAVPQGRPIAGKDEYKGEKKYHGDVEEVKFLPPNLLKPMAQYERNGALSSMEKSGLSPEEWASGFDFETPIEASIFSDGEIKISDGHHRALAAEILKRDVPVRLKSINAKAADINRLIDMQPAAVPESVTPEQFQVTFKEPQTLIGFLRANGLKDFKGELKAADINKRFPGLVRKNGMEIDKAREAAEEAGYLPSGSTPDDLIQAVLSDKPVYSQFDLDQAADFHAQQRAREFERNVAANRKELEQAFGKGGAEPEVYDAAARLMAHEDIDPELAIALAAETNFNAAPASVGAAASLPASLEGNAIAGKVASTLAKVSLFPTKGGVTQWSPILRILHSKSPKVRELGLSMAENPIYLRKNMEGIKSDPAVETLMKEWQGALADATRANRMAFQEMRKARSNMSPTELADIGGDMTHTEFNEAVAEAMRNNDRSNNPHVQAAAQAWRAKVVDPLKEAAINARILDENVRVDTAASYFTRWWNRGKLIANEPEFKRIVRSWVEGMLPRWQAEFDKETAEGAATMIGKKRADYLAKREAEFEEQFGLFPGEMSQGVADDVFNKLTGRVDDAGVRPEMIKVQARGPLKERTFSIPDKLIVDFLENDVERVMDRYVRMMGADVELANRFGHLDFEKLQAEINADYKKLTDAAKTEKQRMAIDIARQNDIADIKGVWDLLRGTGSRHPHKWEENFEQISRMARHANYIRLMGEASLASLAETVRPAMVHGIMPYMKTIGQLATNLEGIKASVKEAQLAGQVTEMVLGHRNALMTEILDPYSTVGPFEAVMRNMTDVASKWNGIRLLTDGQKSIASVMTQNRILESASKHASLAQSEKAYLAYLHIDQRMAERITEQFRDHGKIIDGIRVAGTEKWTDDIARRTYRAALNKDVDSTITTPGVADVPLFVNTPVGAAMMQFRRFALASHQRVLLRGLQESRTRFLGGLIAMASLGMFVTWLKAYSANREEKLSDFSQRPGWWVGEGIDRSGVLSMPLEAANAFEKLAGFNPIKTPLQTFDRGEARLSQKLQNRNKMGVIFGPTLGFGEDIYSAVEGGSAALKGERPTKGQKNATERILPFNSYPGVRQFMRYIANPQ